MAVSDAVIPVAARDGVVHLDVARTAVVVVDMQNDFGARMGMFDRAGIDISGIQAAVAPTRRVLDAARAAGFPIVYLKMAFKDDLSDAGLPDAPNWRIHSRLGVGDRVETPDGGTGRVLIRDTWNTDILPALAPEPGDLIVYKHRYSGFFQTELHESLQRAGIRSLVLVGCTTSVCVESTFRDAMFLDYQCLVLSDCTSEPIGAGNHEASLGIMQTMFGWVTESEQFVSVVEQLPRAGDQVVPALA